jgi:multidrug efflux system membrane fusion protein
MSSTLSFLRRRWPHAAGAVVAIAAAGAAAIVTGFDAGKAHAGSAPGAPPATPVSVATVVESDVTAWNEFSGRLEAVERVDIRSRVAGAVQSVHFREGSLVAKGDLLITIDPAPYAAEVERAEATVGAAQARLTNADNEQTRAQRLWEDSAIARRELDERVNSRREAEANLRAAQAQLQTTRLSLGYTQVRAPVAGRVGRIEVTTGNLVAAGPGAPVLTTLVSVSPIYASFEADEQTLVGALKTLPAGSSARQLIERIPVQMATSLGDTQHAGRLQLIDNQVDAKSGTVRMRASFDNQDGSLIPGQFARIRMGQPQAVHALLVNERAVGTDQDKKFVLVVGPGDKAEYREVTLGAPVDGLRVVRSGLKSGERIVVNGLQRVRPGSVVQPQQVEMTARPAVTAVAAKS